MSDHSFLSPAVKQGVQKSCQERKGKHVGPAGGVLSPSFRLQPQNWNWGGPELKLCQNCVVRETMGGCVGMKGQRSQTHPRSECGYPRHMVRAGILKRSTIPSLWTRLASVITASRNMQKHRGGSTGLPTSSYDYTHVLSSGVNWGTSCGGISETCEFRLNGGA